MNISFQKESVSGQFTLGKEDKTGQGWSSLVVQWVKDPALPLKRLGLLLWHMFHLWPRNFHMPRVHGPKKAEERKEGRKEGRKERKKERKEGKKKERKKERQTDFSLASLGSR